MGPGALGRVPFAHSSPIWCLWAAHARIDWTWRPDSGIYSVYDGGPG